MAEALRLSDFQNTVSKLLKDLPGEMLEINQILALEAKQKITDRLTERGETAEGNSLGKYSTRPMSPLFFLGQGIKSADAKLKAKIKQQKKSGQRPGISYEEWRSLNGLPVNHVTLSFTNETLSDIGVLNSNSENNKVITEVGSKDLRTKNIVNKKGKVTGTKTTGEVLDDLNDKYGRALDTELLSLSKEEESDLMEILDRRLQTFLDKNFA